MKKLSMEPYKGMRDFYPKEMALQNYIRNTMSSVVKKYGYQEYGASILEETDLYRAKTGEEIVNEQTYSFTDRGGRDVTLRPEMTPTIARMVSRKRRDLALPIRWYSIPNCFRYEKPQRGRVREFWQLNIDLLGDESSYADAEIISVAYEIMRTFGAKPEGFLIKINNRALMDRLFRIELGLNEEQSYRLSKLIDKKDKISEQEFKTQAKVIVSEKFVVLKDFLSATNLSDLSPLFQNTKEVKDLFQILEILNMQGVCNCVFDPSLMRGFDYYTGMVFEVFDTGPENRRSLFGGGRFDKLVDLFGAEPVSAVGFGMGDLPVEGYLETYSLIPKIETSVRVRLCVVSDSDNAQASVFANLLRKNNISVAIDFTDRKVDKKIKNARRGDARYIVTFDSKENKDNSFVFEEIETGKRQKMSIYEIIAFLAKT